MIINKIDILGLFGRFDHSLELAQNDPITIMIGPNGFGKTMILSAINALFNRSPRFFAKLPFKKLSVEFGNKSRIEVERRVGEKQSPQVDISYIGGQSECQTFTVGDTIDAAGLTISADEISDIVPFLRRIDNDEWVNYDTGEHLNLGEILDQFGDELPWNDEAQRTISPKWFTDIREKVSVRFINTERLTSPSRIIRRRARHRYYANMVSSERTINQYSRELADEVKRSLTQYGSLSQKLDRTFPNRVVQETIQSGITMDHLRQELADVEEARSKLVKAGLLGHDYPDWNLPSLENIDAAKQGVLAVYAKDAKEKLRLFDGLYKKIDTLKRIANERLLNKTVSVNNDGLKVTNDEGSVLDLAMLSSGEQHELVILYELLFRVPKNGFILFDEPELSFHVAWQEKFLEDLLEMAGITNFRVLLATHSPQIIGDRWDLTVTLKEPNST